MCTAGHAATGWEQAQQEAAKNGKTLPGASSWRLILSRRGGIQCCSHASAWGAPFGVQSCVLIPDMVRRVVLKLVWHVLRFELVALGHLAEVWRIKHVGRRCCRTSGPSQIGHQFAGLHVLQQPGWGVLS